MSGLPTMYWSASFLARSGNSSSLLDPATSIRTLSPPSPLSSLGTPAARNKTGWGVNCGLIPHPIRPRSPRGYSVAEADKGRSKHEPRSDRPEPLIDRVSSGRLDHLDGPRLDLHPAHLLRGCWFVVGSRAQVGCQVGGCSSQPHRRWPSAPNLRPRSSACVAAAPPAPCRASSPSHSAGDASPGKEERDRG